MSCSVITETEILFCITFLINVKSAYDDLFCNYYTNFPLTFPTMFFAEIQLKFSLQKK